VKDIAAGLNVTEAAVTQYIHGKRGKELQGAPGIEEVVGVLGEKAALRMRSGQGPLQAVELLEAARQVLVIQRGRSITRQDSRPGTRNKTLERLRTRLQLELRAAEKYLELANRTPDDQTKLLLRLIASDSIKHADVVSQMISWLESETRMEFEVPPHGLLENLLAIEDSAGEENLGDTVPVGHPVAKLLLEWIDADEAKHGRVVQKMLGLAEPGRESRSRRAGRRPS